MECVIIDSKLCPKVSLKGQRIDPCNQKFFSCKGRDLKVKVLEYYNSDPRDDPMATLMVEYVV